MDGGRFRSRCRGERRPGVAEHPVVGAVLIALGLCGFAGCAKARESTACIESRTRAREAALQGNLELAEKLLGEARSRCGEKSAESLRRVAEILAERRENEKELAPPRTTPQDDTRSARAFVRWVIESRAAIGQHAARARCAEQGSAEFGFCEVIHPDSPQMSLRYWKTQEAAFRFALTSQEPLHCEDLGEQRRVRAWSRAGASYELCEPTQHALRSLTALLVQTASGNQLYVFSQAYVRRDRAFERLLDERT